jgi:hypothetical protein
MVSSEHLNLIINVPKIGTKVREIDALDRTSQPEPPIMLDRHLRESTALPSCVRRNNGALFAAMQGVISGDRRL